MSAGLPVVASDIPGNRDLVNDGETGFLVRLGDRAGFASRTNELLKDLELGQRLGAAAKLRVQREFTVERMVESHEALYRSLLGNES
jgi:glycosyltransferase involved in cell wall biosynthesis